MTRQGVLLKIREFLLTDTLAEADDFREYGLDHLDLAELIRWLGDEFGTPLSTDSLFNEYGMMISKVSGLIDIVVGASAQVDLGA